MNGILNGNTLRILLAGLVLAFVSTPLMAQGNAGGRGGGGLSAELAELQQQVADLEQELAVLKTLTANEVGALQAQNGTLQTQLDTLTTTVTTLLGEFGGHALDTVVHHPRYADSEAILAVGPHFTGNHADLTNVTSSQHHASESTQVAELEDLLIHFERQGNDISINGANLHVNNGLASTSTTNGLGNIFIGYNGPENVNRTGSHNLVVGHDNNYTGYGGIVAGERNSITDAWSAAIGGRKNEAHGLGATIFGGSENWVRESAFSSIVGGLGNSVGNGSFGVVVGGDHNSAGISDFALTLGGRNNHTSHEFSVTMGGFMNGFTGVGGGGYVVLGGCQELPIAGISYRVVLGTENCF